MKPEALHINHNLIVEQLADAEEVQRHLAQPSPWLAAQVSLIPETSIEPAPAKTYTAEEMRQCEATQEHLVKQSPWLK